MTTNDQVVAKALEQAIEVVEAIQDGPEARARNVAALEAAIGGKERTRPPRLGVARWFALAAALLALAATGVWLQARARSVGEVVASTGAFPVGHWLGNEEWVETREAEVKLSLNEGVILHLQPRTELQLRDRGTRVLVRRGEVAAEVISRESSFYLDSGETGFATRGARFRVKAGAGCDGRSEITVSEGQVAVGGQVLGAGEAWPRCTQPVLIPAPVAPTQAIVPKPSATPAPVKDQERLAQQNELYLKALKIHRAGDTAAAVKKLDLIASDERSPLAETALAQKMKWLTATHRADAREVAREYLQRFPMGFGRADAETLVLEPE